MPAEKMPSVTKSTIKIIKVIRFKNRKLTKEIFRSIEIDNITDLSAYDLIGWVMDDGVWILFESKRRIKKRLISSVTLDGYSIYYLYAPGPTASSTEKNEASLDAMKQKIETEISNVQQRCDQLFIGI